MHIPGIAPCFLYMNDDMFLAAPVSKEHFFDRHGNLRLQMTRNPAPNNKRAKHNVWHASVSHTNALINKFYYPTEDPASVQHMYVHHACYFMRTDVSTASPTSTMPMMLLHVHVHTGGVLGVRS